MQRPKRACVAKAALLSTESQPHDEDDGEDSGITSGGEEEEEEDEDADLDGLEAEDEVAAGEEEEEAEEPEDVEPEPASDAEDSEEEDDESLLGLLFAQQAADERDVLHDTAYTIDNEALGSASAVEKSGRALWLLCKFGRLAPYLAPVTDPVVAALLGKFSVGRVHAAVKVAADFMVGTGARRPRLLAESECADILRRHMAVAISRSVDPTKVGLTGPVPDAVVQAIISTQGLSQADAIRFVESSAIFERVLLEPRDTPGGSRFLLRQTFGAAHVFMRAANVPEDLLESLRDDFHAQVAQKKQAKTNFRFGRKQNDVTPPGMVRTTITCAYAHDDGRRRVVRLVEFLSPKQLRREESIVKAFLENKTVADFLKPKLDNWVLMPVRKFTDVEAKIRLVPDELCDGWCRTYSIADVGVSKAVRPLDVVRAFDFFVKLAAKQPTPWGVAMRVRCSSPNAIDSVKSFQSRAPNKGLFPDPKKWAVFLEKTLPNLHRRLGYLGHLGVVPGALKNTKLRIELRLLAAGDMKGQKTQGTPPTKGAKGAKGGSSAKKAKTGD